MALTVKTGDGQFDETVDVALCLGVNPKYSDQMVRGAVSLPHGLGKTVRVLAFCKGDKEAEAREAGADFVGSDELIEKIKGGFLDFDSAVATPDMMATVGKIGKILGPRGLMPNAKTGTDTLTSARPSANSAGKVEFKVDKAGVLHLRWVTHHRSGKLLTTSGLSSYGHAPQAFGRQGDVPAALAWPAPWARATRWIPSPSACCGRLVAPSYQPSRPRSVLWPGTIFDIQQGLRQASQRRGWDVPHNFPSRPRFGSLDSPPTQCVGRYRGNVRKKTRSSRNCAPRRTGPALRWSPTFGG
jgi:hypothetical protein